jgi:hypothetical protein
MPICVAMAISRPFLLALLGAALLGATFFAVQSARNNTAEPVAPAVISGAEEQAAVPAKQPAPAASPEELLKSAFQGGDIDSTAFTAGVSARGDGERASFEISGAFERGAANDLPEIEVGAEGSVPGQRFEGGFVTVGDAAYFTQGEAAWRVPDEVWDPLVEAVERDGFRAESLALPVDPQRWVRDAKSEGTETLDGVETTHLSASVDAERVARDVLAAVRASGREVPGNPAAAVGRRVKGAELDAWVGTDDRILRRLAVEVAVVDGGERGVLSLDIRLTGVNEPQDIEAPANVRQGLPGGAFGRFAQGFTAGLSGAGGGRTVSLAALTSRNPQRAARAVAAHKKVVIFFRNPDGLDDRAMSRVVRAVDRRTQAVVLTDHVDAVDRYGELVEDLGVSQTPSVVLVDRSGEARLIEGYVDTQTLAQAVADAR